MAANATFALKAGVWVRRVRLLIVSPDSTGTACPLSGRNSTYRPVQISGAGSLSGASFTAVEQLQEHIDAFIAAYNETAEPFAWTKKKVYQRRFKNRRITQL
jgi:hypothetical protein